MALKDGPVLLPGAAAAARAAAVAVAAAAVTPTAAVAVRNAHFGLGPSFRAMGAQNIRPAIGTSLLKSYKERAAGAESYYNQFFNPR